MNINILGNNCSFDQGTIQGNGWQTFITRLTESGARLFFNDMSRKQYDLLIAFDHYQWMERIIENISVPINKRILIIQEPEVVLPRMYKASVINLYGVHFAGSIDWAEKLGATPFEYPLDLRSNIYPNITVRSIDTTMIQSNKFSCIAGEQYSLRRAVLKLAKEKNYDIDLYGAGWNRGFFADFISVSKYLKAIRKELEIDNVSNPFQNLGLIYPNYKGKVDDKTVLLNSVRKNIVIENSANYVSEKLFDTLRSGCAPFYVGPKLEKYGIPESIVIRCQTNPQSILENLQTVDLDILEKVVDEGEKFKNSVLYKNWDAQTSINKILDKILEKNK